MRATNEQIIEYSKKLKEDAKSTRKRKNTKNYDSVGDSLSVV